jgi:hypothetical protein
MVGDASEAELTIVGDVMRRMSARLESLGASQAPSSRGSARLVAGAKARLG